MSRITACFDVLQARHSKALIPFITAGDPSSDITVALMHAMVEVGADIIELGIPFSDPMADGPVIQRANERALKNHVSLNDVLAMVTQFRSKNTTTPVVLMGYLNPIEIMGYKDFADKAQEAGVDGVITVDLPPEEAEDFVSILAANQLDPIFLLAPTSTDERIEKICRMASGFVYYVSLKGVTGAASLDVSAVAVKLEQIRSFTKLPIGVGFGIKDANTAGQVAQISDAIVVGSALVNLIERFSGQADKLVSEVSTVLSGMRQTMDKEVTSGKFHVASK